MPKPPARSQSRYSAAAIALLGKLIREARQHNRVTTTELAARAGISRALLQRIEKGDPGCSIGAVFEVAAIVGVPLFEPDARNLAVRLAHAAEKQALLPKAVHPSRKAVKDDF